MIRNIIANFIGRFWSVLSNYLFIPLYLSILGIESYSIISFSFIAIGFMAIFDAGLSATLTKEFASSHTDSDYKRKLFNTLESIYILIAISIVILFLVFSNYIASNWLNLNSAKPSDVSMYIKILGFGIASQLIANFYMGGLIGLEKQVISNLYQLIWGVTKNGLVVLIIWIYPSLYVFFIWQAAVTILYVFIIRGKLISYIPSANTKRFTIQIEKEIINNVWRFASGMLIIATIASVNSQLDKIIISKMLNIIDLGYYNIANTMALGLLTIVSPFSVATLPRFTKFYSNNLLNDSNLLFNNIFKLICVIIFTLVFTISFNSESILWIWTGDHNIATKVSMFVPFLTIGTGLLALQTIPFNIAIANGYTKLNSILSILSLLFTVPAYFFFINKYGAISASIIWMSLQVVITPIYLFLINKKFIKQPFFKIILLKNMFVPLFLPLVLSYLLFLVNIHFSSRIYNLLYIAGITTTVFVISFLVVFPVKYYSTYITAVFSRKQ